MKNNLIQLVYISRSTFLSVGSNLKIEPQVVKILSESKTNNKKNGLVGALFFGDGCFLECLEGDEMEIDALYQVLQKDSRHKDLKIISRKSITYPSFQKWSMKYVPFDASIKDLLLKNGYERFDPYSFNEEMISKVMELLLDTDEPLEVEAATEKLNKKFDKWALYLPVFLITLYFMQLLISSTHS